MARHLLKNLEEIRKLLAGRRPSFFLDYDGTLIPPGAGPEDSERATALLAKLSKKYPVAVVSGRKLSNLVRDVGVEGVASAGNHGFEISHEDFSMVFDAGQEARAWLGVLKERFDAIASNYPWSQVEDKGLAITVHYGWMDKTKIPALRSDIKDAAREAVARGVIRLRNSKMALEVQPNADWDKGKAVLWMLERPFFKDTTPIYMGDDQTDRYACKALKGRSITVYVGGVVEEAAFYLKKQAEVISFLDLIAE